MDKTLTSLNREELAVKMSKWWADRLNPQHEDKRSAFEEDLKMRIIQHLNETSESLYLENDYDPRGILLDSVITTIDPNCRGYMFSGKGIFPEKHTLDLIKGKIEAKEGYGNWTGEI